MNEIIHPNPRFYLVEVITPHRHKDDAIRSFDELESLIATYGGQVIERTIQHRVRPHPASYIGSGKIEFLKGQILAQNIDIVVLNAIVNAGQIFRLERSLWDIKPDIMVWDRVDLILHIFDKHASSTEAKLQIELARLEHLGPRIYGLGGTYFSRQAGGIGTRGLGETNIELMRRQIKDRTKKIRKELNKLAAVKENVIHRRKDQGVTTIALVGYTNAGKTTLFNFLTGKNKITQNSFFTTLDSVLGRLKNNHGNNEMLISDTIGFIEDLPPLLIDAFRSTLLESVNADIILHVVDASDPKMDFKIEAVDRILAELLIDMRKVRMIFNKSDNIPPEKLKYIRDIYTSREPLFISARTGMGIDVLQDVFKFDN